MASPQALLQSDVSSKVSRAVEEGDWTLIERWMDSGQLSDQQKVWVIKEINRYTNSQQFLQHIYPFCSSTQIDSAMTQLISEGLWKDVLNLSLCVGEENRKWKVGNETVDNSILCVVAKGRWHELGALLHRGVHLTAPQRRWALLQACQHAMQRDILEVVVPYCADEDLHSLLKELVSRRLWWAVGSLIRQRHGVSEAQQTWVINKAAKEATTWELTDYILPLCTKNQLRDTSKQLLKRRLWWALRFVLHKDPHKFSECVVQVCGDTDMDLFVTHLISEGQWNSVQTLLLLTGKQNWRVGNVIIPRQEIQFAAEGRWAELAYQAHTSSNHPLLAWVMQEMSKRAGQNEIGVIVVHMCPIDQIPYVLEKVVKRGFVDSAAKLLCRLVGEVVEGWAVASSSIQSNKEAQFWSMIRNLSFDSKVVSELCKEVHKEKLMYSSLKLLSNLVWHTASDLLSASSPKQILCQIVCNSAIDIVLVSLCSQQDKPIPFQSVSDRVDMMINKILREIRTGISLHDLLQNIQHMCIEFNPTTRTEHVTNPLFALSFIRAIMKNCCSQVQWSFITENMLAILTTVPVVPSVQCEALRAMLSEKKWDTIRQADLSQVSEVVRRQLFQVAVKRKQWGVVKRWADHSLHDDQRSWALKIASKEKQWDVLLDLAGDGLTEDEVIRVHCCVAQCADWNVVLNMYKHEADVSEVKELLTSAARGTVRTDEKQKLEQRVCQLAEVEASLKCRMEFLKTLESAVEQDEWQLVLFTVRQRPTADSVCLALKAAAARKVWHVVIQLFRLGTYKFDEPSFFHEMIEKQQWRVCRVMIEQGLNVELYVDVIPKLMELNQWNLVAKMMEHDVEDAVRRQVMRCALERRQGTVVSQSIQGMKQRLTLQEREDLFHKSIVHDVLQAVRPLVEEKDDTGVQHRDVAMLHAIRQKQWDIVDLCQHHHANINMLDEHGNTPALIAAQNGDWDAVTALIKRGSDHSLTDSQGKLLIHMAIEAKKWECVKLLITYPCQMQQAATHKEEKRTPLEMLIKAGQQQIIEHAVLHCPAQWKGVNPRGETTLHTICLSGLPSIMRSLLDRGADPLSVTRRGHSVLSYAVLSKNPRKMVSECISLGFTTHQPHITKCITSQRTRPLLSPALLPVMSGLPEETEMLYESGFCSFRELFQVLPELVHLADPSSKVIRSKMTYFQKETAAVYSKQENDFGESHHEWFDLVCPFKRPQKSLIRKSARYLMEVSSTPRSLKSICRLVISHCLRVCGSRDRDISQLPISNPLKDYVSFSDLLPADDGQSARSGTDGTGHDGGGSEEDDHIYDEEYVYEYGLSDEEQWAADSD